MWGVYVGLAQPHTLRQGDDLPAPTMVDNVGHFFRQPPTPASHINNVDLDNDPVLRHVANTNLDCPSCSPSLSLPCEREVARSAGGIVHSVFLSATCTGRSVFFSVNGEKPGLHQPRAGANVFAPCLGMMKKALCAVGSACTQVDLIHTCCIGKSHRLPIPYDQHCGCRVLSTLPQGLGLSKPQEEPDQGSANSTSR